MYGFSEKQLKEIIQIFSSYKEIDEAILFGSRAKGTHKEASDVDIAIKGKNITYSFAAKLKSHLEDDTNLPYFFDIIAYKTITSKEVKEHIRIYGKTIISGSKNIPKGWLETTLGEVTNISSSKRIFHSDYVSEGIPFYRSKEIIEKHKGNKISNNLFITIEKFNEINKKFGSPMENDILLTSVGTLGIPYLVKPKELFYFKDGNLTWFSEFKDIFPQYLYNWLLSSKGKEELEAITIGSTQKAITIAGLKTIPILLPELKEQKQIAKILTSFDDKIDLLQAQNKTLEDIGQTIFKEWFGKYQVGDELPEGWEKCKIEYLCKKITSGGTPPTEQESYYNGNINWYSTKELKDSFLFDSMSKITEQGLNNSSAKLFPKHTVLIAIYASPTVGRLGILTSEAAFNQAACGLVVNESLCCYEFLYLYLKSQRSELNSMASGSAQQNLNVSKIKNYPVYYS